MSDKRIRYVFTVDLTPFAEAIQALARAVSRAAPAIRRMIHAIADPRLKYGWQTNRAGQWISPVCASWVHEGCPLPHHCACTCDHPDLPVLEPQLKVVR